MSDSGPPTINITNVAEANNQGCGSGCGGCLAAGFTITVLCVFIAAGYLLGTWVAVAIFGAQEDSTAAVTLGWIFEIVYLIFLALIGSAMWRNRQKWFSKGDDTATDHTDSAALGGPYLADTYIAPSPPGAASPEPELEAPHSATVFCHQCGAQTKEGAKFCSNCGTAL